MVFLGSWAQEPDPLPHLHLPCFPYTQFQLFEGLEGTGHSPQASLCPGLTRNLAQQHVLKSLAQLLSVLSTHYYLAGI